MNKDEYEFLEQLSYDRFEYRILEIQGWFKGALKLSSSELDRDLLRAKREFLFYEAYEQLVRDSEIISWLKLDTELRAYGLTYPIN